MNIFIFFSLFTALFLAAAAIWFRGISPDNLHVYEPWPRAKLPGLLIGWAVLFICVPHARAIAPESMQILLWPLAFVVPLLGYFYIDYPLARAAGGAMILWSYYAIQLSFQSRTAMGGAIAVESWLWGIAGIWISARPSALRDLIRLAAAKKPVRLTGAAFMLICSLSWVAAVLVKR